MPKFVATPGREAPVSARPRNFPEKEPPFERRSLRSVEARREPAFDARARPPPRPRARDLSARRTSDRVRAPGLGRSPRGDRAGRLCPRRARPEVLRAHRREPPTSCRARARLRARSRAGRRGAKGPGAPAAGTGPVRRAARRVGPMTFVRLARVRFLALILMLWASVVVARLAELQLAQGSRYRARAQRQQERRIEVSPLRGSIFDREGRPLAVSVEVSSVYAIPDDVKDPAETARALARHLDVPEAALLTRLTQKRGFVWLARKIDRNAAAALKKAKIPGVHLVPETKRFYPKGSLAAALLGYVGLDDKGLGGLEHSYDEVIRGKPGEVIALTDARRSTYGEADVANGRPPQEGASLVVTIDSGIQFAAEQALTEAVTQAQARSGVAILLDPSDGSVLAMASAPGFDPNDYGHYSAEARRNHAIADAHEPGSTFKIVTGAVALENSVVTLDEAIDTGDGTIRVGNAVISEHDHKHFGALTLAEIFEHSSNVGIIRVGLRLGPERLWNGATALGVGRASGIDLPGENAGIFRRPERWSMLSNATISMGQEVSLTPLQLARAAAAIANGGSLVRPRLVRRIAHPNGRVETF